MKIEDIEPDELRSWLKKLAEDLLSIAEQAMPDTYFHIDSRCVFARKTLLDLQKLD